MSKIICDVCGTSYPESSSQCPICGCVRSADIRAAYQTGEAGSIPSNGEYTYIKGGRFSKSNVKKRNRGEQLPQNSLSKESKAPKKKNRNTGLVIAVILLVLAIFTVLAYIYFRFFRTTDNDKNQNRPTHSASQVQGTAQDATTPSAETTVPTTPSTDATDLVIPCTGLDFSATNVQLDKQGSVRLLDVGRIPEDTTDILIFSSSDESVVTVNDDGKLQAVGGGEAVITITCGDISVSCRVVCAFESDTTEATTEPETQPLIVTAEDFKLLKEDVTLSYKDESWICYDEDAVGIPAKEIEWSSDDEKVATVTNGKVVAVSTGVTTIRAKYDGMEATCVVRCAASVGAYVEPTEPTEGDNSEPTVDKTCTISSTDVTITVGEQFDLVLQDAEGYPLDAQWQVSNECCTVEGNIVTGAVAGIAEVFCIYNDVKYVCIVRVR